MLAILCLSYHSAISEAIMFVERLKDIAIYPIWQFYEICLFHTVLYDSNKVAPIFARFIL